MRGIYILKTERTSYELLYAHSSQSVTRWRHMHLGSELVCFPDLQCFLEDGTALVHLPGIHHLKINTHYRGTAGTRV